MALKKKLYIPLLLLLLLAVSGATAAFWNGDPGKTSLPETAQTAPESPIPVTEALEGEESNLLPPEVSRYLVLDSITLPTANAEKKLLLQILEHYGESVSDGEKAKIRKYIGYCEAVITGWQPTPEETDRHNSQEPLEIGGTTILTMYDPRDLVIKSAQLQDKIEQNRFCDRLRIRQDAGFTTNLQAYLLLNDKRLCGKDVDWHPKMTRENSELYKGIFQILSQKPTFHEIKNFFTKADFHRVAEPYWQVIYFDYLHTAYEENDMNHPQRFFLGQYADYLIELYPEVVHLHNYLTLGRRFNL